MSTNFDSEVGPVTYCQTALTKYIWNRDIAKHFRDKIKIEFKGLHPTENWYISGEHYFVNETNIVYVARIINSAE